MPPNEHAIEWAVVGQIANWWSKVVCIKLTAIGVRGWPDRLFLAPEGTIIFVEFKKPGGKVRGIQKYVHNLLRDLGFEVQVHDNASVAVEEIKAYIRAKASSAPSD